MKNIESMIRGYPLLHTRWVGGTIVASHGAILTIRQVDEHLQNVIFVDIVEKFPFPRQFAKSPKVSRTDHHKFGPNFAVLCKP